MEKSLDVNKGLFDPRTQSLNYYANYFLQCVCSTRTCHVTKLTLGYYV